MPSEAETSLGIAKRYLDSIPKDFLSKNKDMAWPELFDKDRNPKDEWSPVATEWGVTRIPTMFLIDRKGILRSVNAEEDYEKEIPKLLEEKAE